MKIKIRVATYRKKGIDTMTNEKMTYGKALSYVLTSCDLPSEVAEKLTALSASIAKKNSAERKPTAKQKEGASIKEAIVEWMEHGHLYSAAEIAKECPICADGAVSSTRVAALLKQAFECGQVVITTEKRKNYYSLA